LKKKTILISGANSELSKGIFDKLSKKYNIILIYHKNKPILKKHHKPKLIKFSTNENFNNLIKKLKNDVKQISGVIHFNGIHSFDTFRTITESKFDEIYKINCFSFINLVKASYFFPNVNSIISISSVSSKNTSKGIPLYSSSKSALNLLVKSAAKELAKKKIRVNSIILGHMEFGMSRITKKFLNADQLFLLEKEHLLGFGIIEDLYHSVDFLLDMRKSRWITGTEFVLDGGYLA